MVASESSNKLVPNSLYAQFKVAKIWQDKGKIERAIEGYYQILELNPKLTAIHREIAPLLLKEERISESIAICRQGIKIDSSISELHKVLITALIKQGGFHKAFDNYQLKRVDNKKIEISYKDILCYGAMRNEFLRLPFFLNYYRQQGVTKFLIVDNNSNDRTSDYLLEQPDVYIWSSNYSYQQSNYGVAWMEILLRKYGVGNWCLIVDADEIFYYPDCEQKSIFELCQELETRDKIAFKAVLLDMYSDGAIKDTHYQRGQNMLEICPYFDKIFYHQIYQPMDDPVNHYHNQIAYMGGVRARIFGEQGNYYLSKVPLIKYNEDVLLAVGQHWTNLPQNKIAHTSGCLLHFKYFANLIDYIPQEVQRKEHYGEAIQYKEYAKILTQNESLTLYDSRYSVKLENSQQLIALGIMHKE